MSSPLHEAAAKPVSKSGPETIRVLALIEGSHVTGPAKCLIEIAGYGKKYAGTGVRLDITPVIFTRADFRPDPLIRALENAGLSFASIHENRRFDTSVFEQVRALVCRLQPDIIQTHMAKSHFIVRYSGAAVRLPWLAFHHGYTKVDLKVRFYNQFDRWSLRGADHIVAVCGMFANRLKARGIPPQRITVQHNSVDRFVMPDPAETAALKLSLGLNGPEPVLLAVGRLSTEKGFADLVEAAALLSSRTSNFRLVIVGEGPERPRLETAIQRFKLSGRVLLAGHTNRIAPYYALASMLVISSHSEGSPNMLLEGMAARLPVVATAAGGIPEIVRHDKEALLVPCGDPVRLSQAMYDLLEDPERADQLAAAALEAALNRYSISARYEALAGLLRTLKCSREGSATLSA